MHIYKGTQVSDALVEIFLNGENGKRFPLKTIEFIFDNCC